MSQPLRIVQFGLGAIGTSTARLILQRPGFELVGGVDVDPAKVGRDLGEVLQLENTLGIRVCRSLKEALQDRRADVVLHTTSSHFHQILPQLSEILSHRLNVVSTSEELAFPWRTHPQEADHLDRLARRQDVTVLATGVNPGFLMDSLPLFLTSACQQVELLRIQRAINASLRRGPFQNKIGSGLSPEAFQKQVESGRLGHVGLRESMHMIFDTLRVVLEDYRENIEPIVATRTIQTPHVRVEPGQVCGLRQRAVGMHAGRPFVELIFEAALENEQDGDAIEIQGVPSLSVHLNGTNGDLCTTAIAVNALPRAVEAPAGLLTMRDLPLLSWTKGPAPRPS